MDVLDPDCVVIEEWNIGVHFPQLPPMLTIVGSEVEVFTSEGE